jgi:hypothetical protein
MDIPKEGEGKQKTGGYIFAGVGCHFDDITKSKMYNIHTYISRKGKRRFIKKSVIEGEGGKCQNDEIGWNRPLYPMYK